MSEVQDLAPVDALLDPGRRHREGSSYSYKANIMLWQDAGDDVRAGHAAHELSHVLMHASTPYGYFLDKLSALGFGSVVFFYRDFPVHFGYPSPFPGYRFGRRVLAGDVPPAWSHQSDPALRALVEEHIVPWSEAAFLESVLEGHDTAGVRDAAQPRAARALAAVERADLLLTDDEARFNEIGRILDAIPDRPAHLGREVGTEADAPACLSTSHDGRQYPLGGSNVFESLAVNAERQVDMQYLVEQRFAYAALWVLFISRYGVERHIDEARYFALRRTFDVICDLALFTPIGAVYGRLRPPDASWRDVHPGLRFLVALEVIGIRDLWTAGADALPLQQEISELVGWPAPERFLELGRYLAWTNADARRHAKACDMRADVHDVFLDQEAHIEALQPFVTEYLPMLWDARRGALVVRRHALDVTDAMNLVLDYYFAQLSWDLMMSDRVIGSELLPETLDFGELFPPGNPTTPQEFLDVVYKGLPYFRPAKLRHIDV